MASTNIGKGTPATFHLAYNIWTNRHQGATPQNATEPFTEMIALQPDNAQYHTRRGIARAEIADYQGAINDFDKAPAVRGLNADLHNLLAHARMHAEFAQHDEFCHPPTGRPSLTRPPTGPTTRPKTAPNTRSRPTGPSRTRTDATAWPETPLPYRLTRKTRQAKPARLAARAPPIKERQRT